jgi:PAS domain S-box-containing protein
MREMLRVSSKRGVPLPLLRGVWALLCVASFVLAATPQSIRVTPVGEAIRNRNHSLVHEGETLEITGVVTDESHDVGSGNSLANLEDKTGGIALFGSHAVLPPGAFQRGDLLQVRGKVAEFRGMEELQVESVRRIETAQFVVPQDALAKQLLGEQYSGRLVRVKGQLILGANGEVTLRDRSGEIPVYMFHSFYQNTRFMQRLLEGGPAAIVGLARQRIEQGQSRDSGYLLSPRDWHDFQFGTLPKYREMALAGLLVILGFAYLWWLRRAAEERARKLAILSEGLKESDERFRQMADSIDQAFWMLDVGANRILYASPAFERIWGRSLGSVVERRAFLDTIHPDDRARVEEYLATAATVASKETYRIVRPDGAERWILERTFPVLNRDGKPYRVTGTWEDVTDRRALEEQLRQAQKMEAVGRLAGGIAHDFNNLLTVIGGYLQMILDATPPTDPRYEKLREILAASTRASALTRQLLAFGRRQMVQPKLVQVNHLVTNMEALLRRVMGEHIRLETDLGSEIPCVKADPNQLEQVLINLAANARDAMPEGGEFRIQTAVVAGSGDRASANDVGPRVRIQISDTGCGMSKEVMEHVFEPFFTTKGVGKGTGLGLSSVYGIIQQNHGTIDVSSSPGRGTTFRIFLPGVFEMEEAKSYAEPAENLRGTETILVAEDEPGVRKLVCETLGHLGYTVLQAANGQEALCVLENHDPVHLILTDVIMPVMGGRDLAERVSRMRPAVKVVYMSGYNDDTLASHGLPQPDTPYIQKPFTLAALAAKLRQILSAEGAGAN